MAITHNELLTIINAVISAIRANSKTIEQLSPATALKEEDSVEVSGGKRVSYQVLKGLIIDELKRNVDNNSNDIDNLKRALKELQDSETGNGHDMTTMTDEEIDALFT